MDNKIDKNTNSENYQITYISEDMQISGDVKCKSSVILNGKITKAKLNCEDSVIIDKSGSFSGNLEAKNIVILGSFEGEMSAENITLKNGSLVNGNITTDNLILEENATLKGNVYKTEEIKEN